eukprot:scaffold1235_cov358-Prasinococcus_capsulatus_cf.AAC.12
MATDLEVCGTGLDAALLTSICASASCAGPTFVKVAQSLSTRPDLLPREVRDALAELQDRQPPFSTQAAIATIEVRGHHSAASGQCLLRPLRLTVHLGPGRCRAS